MTEKMDISRAVKALIDSHGRNAARVAEQRANAAEAGGSMAAAQTWRQIAKAIQQPQ